MVECRSWSAEPGERVTVKLPGFDFQPGNLVWIEEGRAGIAFEEILHDLTVSKLKNLIMA